jgi:hypothetical protein
LARSVCEFCLQGTAFRHKILQHGANDFSSPPKEVVLQIFTAHKDPSLSAEFETADSGSTGKDDNHYTTKNDNTNVTLASYFEMPVLYVSWLGMQKDIKRGVGDML